MTKSDLKGYQDKFAVLLTEDVAPFWLKHGWDRKEGGYFTALDRDGALLDTDKSVWFQGRMSWMFSQMAVRYGGEEYLAAARSGLNFLEAHGFDKEGDGRMYFRLTREGRPVIKRLRYFFSETFTLMAYASYARASGESVWIEKARDLLDKINRLRSENSPLISKFNGETRPSRGFAVPMIMINTLSQLREADRENGDRYNRLIDEEIGRIYPFLNEEHRCVLEQTGPGGEFQDHYEGRTLNPGHAIEGAWFVLAEARRRGSEEFRDLGLKMLDWMWDWGWDDEYGGIIYFRDALGKPCGEYWHDMKFWWPQNEAIIANLAAYEITGEEKYAHRFVLAESWAHEHFHDPEQGEWFGYLHRDGSLSSRAKGTLYKGGFHVPRMYMTCLDILDRLS